MPMKPTSPSKPDRSMIASTNATRYPMSLGDNREADASDVFDQQLAGSGHDDDYPPATGRAGAALVTGSGFWPASEFSSLITQRSLIDDMASLNESYRPNW